MVRRLLLMCVLGVASPALCQQPQPQFYGWQQPSKQIRWAYPTPLRNLLFGTTRTVPTGPPVPYYLVPGRLVPPTIVYPREVQPQIVWPEVPARDGGP